jgi:NADP-dependent aldehyde dehydrogenase
MIRCANALSGQLTATLWADATEWAHADDLLSVLELKVGRLVMNGFPTGVEVGAATMHGGPFPATTDSRFTSVGTRSILRFVRPVAYQNFPEALWPKSRG